MKKKMVRKRGETLKRTEKRGRSKEEQGERETKNGETLKAESLSLDKAVVLLFI